MRAILFIFYFVLSRLQLIGQTPESTPEKFIRFLNNYQVDSLNNLTTNDFRLIENYAKHSFNKKDFLDTFVAQSVAIGGKFKVLQILSKSEPMVFLVEDENFYKDYLEIKTLTWKLTIATSGEHIRSMTSDTTSGYSKYLHDFIKKHDVFLKWLKKSYPGESEESLYDDKTGLLEQRLNEYCKRKG